MKTALSRWVPRCMNSFKERIRIKNVGRSARLITNQGDGDRPHHPRQSLDEACTTWAMVDIGLSGAKIVCPFRYGMRKPISEEKAKQMVILLLRATPG